MGKTKNSGILIGAVALLVASSVARSPEVANETLLLQQTAEEALAKSEGCLSCHDGIEPMHVSTSVNLACVDCHGGNAGIVIGDCHPDNTPVEDKRCADAKRQAHVSPRDPVAWAERPSANPRQSYTLLTKESPEFVRFINPGDLRIADETCGAASCHVDIVPRVQKSMMTTGAMLWGAALYNNGIFPLKDSHFGESYSKDGKPQRLYTVPAPTPEETLVKGVLPYLDPLPRFNVGQPGNILRVFERGGRRIVEVGNPDPFEEPGRPARRLSERGLGTLTRTDPVWLGLQKTRLLDPMLSFLGTNDNPGDYRSSGCTACHVIYANDRDPEHSADWARYGNRGYSYTNDPTIKRRGQESGHPIQHRLTRSIPSSQCMICHVHPGTSVENAYFGTMWWDNESDGRYMYPEKQRELTDKEWFDIRQANPEGATLRGRWSDPEFLAEVSQEKGLDHTRFADFHGHGWNFRNVYKMDRKGNLLDEDDGIVSRDDPERFEKAVHLQDIHQERGLHCIDCHFEQDNHGDGKLYGEHRAATEIECEDCHGSVRAVTNLVTSGNAGPTNMKLLRTPWGKQRFEWRNEERDVDGETLTEAVLYQRSVIREDQEWPVKQVKHTITPGSRDYSELSRYSKTVRSDGSWGNVPDDYETLAHENGDIACYTCHSSWITSCFGCHLPLTSNNKQANLHYEGDTTKSWTGYNFQTLREDLFMLGVDGTVKNNRIAPVRSSCAVLVSSQTANREWLYKQQQTISAEGFSGQAFSVHFPHTVRTKETQQCSSCHLSSENDNNAWLSQVMLLGTGAMNWMGEFAYVASGEHGFAAVYVTEKEEPQAVLGSTLHELAYPEEYKEFVEGGRILERSVHHHAHDARSIQHRGEYVYVAEGHSGLVVYDIANVAHKGFSERFTSAPVSPAGQRFYVRTKDAAAVASPTTLGVDPLRSRRPENQEGPIHLLYGFLYVADREEGLVTVGAGTLLDGDPTNNFLERAVTFNPGGILTGVENLTVAGESLYMVGSQGLAVISLSNPLEPKILATMGAPELVNPRALQVQFRYAFALDDEGLKVLDITDPASPKLVASTAIEDAHQVYLARTYAYVAAGHQGLVIVDIENPTKPRIDQVFNADGEIDDALDVKIAVTNASFFAYLADGHNGLRVIQLTSPETTPNYAGFSPRPEPRLIATWPHETLSVSRGIDRDQAVDESGNQLAVFGRRGARPLNSEEMRRLYLQDGQVYTVKDRPSTDPLPPEKRAPSTKPAPAPEGRPYDALPSRPPR